jgi:hypothetical protein
MTILQNVRHHERDAITADESGLLLQPRRECAAQFIELRIGQGRAHVGVSRRVPIFRAGFLDQRLEG